MEQGFHIQVSSTKNCGNNVTVMARLWRQETHRNKPTPKSGISDRKMRTKTVLQVAQHPLAPPLYHGLWLVLNSSWRVSRKSWSCSWQHTGLTWRQTQWAIWQIYEPPSSGGSFGANFMLYMLTFAPEIWQNNIFGVNIDKHLVLAHRQIWFPAASLTSGPTRRSSSMLT